MGRIVVVSNRVSDLANAAQAGGLAVVISDTLRDHPGLWFGWSGEIARDALPERRGVSEATFRGNVMATMALSDEEYADYYLGYSNSVLWPVFHNRLDLAKFDAGFFASYAAVNEAFAETLLPMLRPDDVVWVHDYHLIPLGAALRRRGVTNAIGYFLHIPVPPAQTFMAIPEHRELALALSAYDLVGLQTKADVANLIKFLETSIGGRILQSGRIRTGERELTIQSFPVGINLEDFVDTLPDRNLVQATMGAERIIGVDRLDYTKGLPQKLAAFGRFLEKYPDYRGKVVLTQIAPPTRETVDAYAEIRSTLEALSGKINGMFGELDWVPIHYIHRSAPRKRLLDIYRSSRIGLFTPLRDGMNLVAKEYIAAQDPDDPGVVILSRFAGAAEQLGDALMVNPYDVDEVAEAIRAALEMTLSERRARYAALYDTIREHDTFAWSRAFLDVLSVCARERLSGDPSASPGIDKALRRLARSPIDHRDPQVGPRRRHREHDEQAQNNGV